MLYKLPATKARIRVIRRRAVPADELRRLEVRTQVRQVWVNLLLVALAVPSVVFAVSTYQDQQRLMRDQQRLNARALERDDQRWASLVTFWETGPYTDKADPRVHVTRMMVRNMSSLPVTDVVLLTTGDDSARRPQVHIPMIPPCHEMEVWVQRGALRTAWQRMGRTIRLADVELWRTARMDFFVGGRGWERTNHRLAPRPTRAHDAWAPVDLAAARIVKNEVPQQTPECGYDG
ncbi:hypothetical protein [Actinoplanes xinjiangensis]|uniref:hypothetical protein n=1 Tax=Actinoplanes xinjiangensis TaxID=512350 RepID=UPI003447421F